MNPNTCFFFTFKIYFTLIYVYMCVCMLMLCVWGGHPLRPEAGARLPGAGVTKAAVAAWLRCWEPSCSPLPDKQGVFITESSLQPPNTYSLSFLFFKFFLRQGLCSFCGPCPANTHFLDCFTMPHTPLKFCPPPQFPLLSHSILV